MTTFDGDPSAGEAVDVQVDEQVPERHPDQLLDRPTGQRGERRVGGADPAVEVQQRDAVGQGVEDLARELLRGEARLAHPEHQRPQDHAEQHRSHGDPFVWPGLQDVTAHVDFSAMAHAAADAGARIAGYGSLAGVLLELGIGEQVLALADPGSVEYARAAAPVQKLLSPAEMGELFKVLGVARGIECEWTCFRHGDRTGRL